jgi:soluble lytic murein transglycosylase-like protein
MNRRPRFRRRRLRYRRYDALTFAGLIAGWFALALLTGCAAMLIAMRPEPRPQTARTVRVARTAQAARAIEPPLPPKPVVRASILVPLSIEIPELHVFDQRATYSWMIRDAALRRALPPKLVEAIVRVESDFNPREVSNKGALGIMQVIPSTGARFGVRRHELFDPARNIAAGTAYLAWLRDRYRGDLDRMLAAYNAGEGAVDRYDGVPPFPETREYVRRVRAELAVLQ